MLKVVPWLAAALISGNALASAIVPTSDWQIKPTITTADDPFNPIYSTPLNAGYDGVVALLMDNGGLCSGSVLGTGMHILTAAHCVTDDFGNSNVSGIDIVSFPGDGSGLVFNSAASWVTHPLWDGDFFGGNDLTVISLATELNPTIQRYDIYNGSDEFGQVTNIAGFGASGTGLTGSVIGAGTRRQAFNEFEGTNVTGNVLFTDFDSGDPLNNLLSLLGGTSSLGLGLFEGNTAPGDSGGPAFINGMIAGITSFGATLGSALGDIDDDVNSTFGELAGFTRVSFYQDWINQQLRAVSAPGMLILMLVSGGFILRRRSK